MNEIVQIKPIKLLSPNWQESKTNALQTVIRLHGISNLAEGWCWMQIWYKLTRILETHLQDGYAWMETASRARTTTAMRTECASFWCIFLLWIVCFLGCCYYVTLLRLFVLKEMSIPKSSRWYWTTNEVAKKKKRSKNFHSSLKTPFNKKIKCWGRQLRRLHFGRNWWLCVGRVIRTEIQ